MLHNSDKENVFPNTHLKNCKNGIFCQNSYFSISIWGSSCNNRCLAPALCHESYSHQTEKSLQVSKNKEKCCKKSNEEKNTSWSIYNNLKVCKNSQFCENSNFSVNTKQRGDWPNRCLQRPSTFSSLSSHDLTLIARSMIMVTIAMNPRTIINVTDNAFALSMHPVSSCFVNFCRVFIFVATA